MATTVVDPARRFAFRESSDADTDFIHPRRWQQYLCPAQVEDVLFEQPLAFLVSTTEVHMQPLRGSGLTRPDG